MFQDDWQEAGCVVRREDGRSELGGFQFPQTIASLPGSLAHSFSHLLAGSLNGCLWWELGRSWAGQGGKTHPGTQSSDCKHKIQTFDSAFMWGIGTCRCPEIWDGDLNQPTGKKKRHPKKWRPVQADTQWNWAAVRRWSGGIRER